MGQSIPLTFIFFKMVTNPLVIHPASRGVAAHTAGLTGRKHHVRQCFQLGLPKLSNFHFSPRRGFPGENFHFSPPWRLPKLGNFRFSPPWGLPKRRNFHFSPVKLPKLRIFTFPPVGAPQAREFSLFPPWGLPKLGNFHFSPP